MLLPGGEQRPSAAGVILAKRYYPTIFWDPWQAIGIGSVDPTIDRRSWAMLIPENEQRPSAAGVLLAKKYLSY